MGSDDFSRRLFMLEEAVRKLSTAERANKTDVRGGFTTWLPDDGSNSPYVQIGGAADGDGPAIWAIGESGSGIFIGGAGGEILVAVAGPDGDAAGRLLDIFAGRMSAPLISCAWQNDPARTVDGNGRPGTTSGGYTRTHAAFLPVTSGGIYSSVIVYPGGGVTSCAVRIRATAFPGGTPVDVYEQTGITTTAFLTGTPWTVPDAMMSPAGSPVGQLALIEIEAQVTGGAGTVAVGPQTPVVNWVV